MSRFSWSALALAVACAAATVALFFGVAEFIVWAQRRPAVADAIGKAMGAALLLAAVAALVAMFYQDIVRRRARKGR